MPSRFTGTTLSALLPLALWLPAVTPAQAGTSTTCEGLPATIVGTDGDDDLQGTAASTSSSPAPGTTTSPASAVTT